MGSDGSCNIAQGNVKGEEIPMKIITPGLYRCQNSCFCFSIVKWATGIGFNLLDLPSLGSEMALSTLSSTQDANWNVPWAAAPQLYICAWDMHPGRLGISLLFTISLLKLPFKKGNSIRTAGQKVMKLCELSFWSVTSSGQGTSPCQMVAKDKATWPLVDNENNSQDTGPRSLQSIAVKNTNHCKTREE